MTYEIQYTVHGITLDLMYVVDKDKVIDIEVFAPGSTTDITPLLSLEEKWGVRKFVEGAWRGRNLDAYTSEGDEI